MDTETLIAALLADVPAERQSAQAVAAALAASKLWPKEYAFLQSWFEPGDATPVTKKQREEAVLRDIIPARRVRWAERLAWTAKAAEDEVEGEERIAFELVARELVGDRPEHRRGISKTLATGRRQEPMPTPVLGPSLALGSVGGTLCRATTRNTRTSSAP